MLDMKLKEAQAGFFDRPHVSKRIEAAARKSLSRIGAFIRRRAQTSIRPRKKGISEPGNPPFGHGPQLLRKFIFFVYDPAIQSVVVGPIKLNKPGAAPRLLEFGGATTQADSRGLVRRMFYRPRPFMRPAFDAELAKIPNAFIDSVKEG